MHSALFNNRSRALRTFVVSALALVLTSCGSPAGSFDYKSELSFFVDHSKICGINTMAPAPGIFGGRKFLSPNLNEAKRYWWVEYSKNDYYQFRLEDPSYLELDLETSLGFFSCADYLRDQVENFEDKPDSDYKTLGALYLEFANNVDSASVVFQAMHELPNTKASRAKYMELENNARGLEILRKDLILAIRQLIDVTYSDNVQIFIERCPIYFNVFGNVTSDDGIVYLKNYGDSAQDIDLTFGYTDDDGVIVGQDYIITTVPARSTMKQTITGSSSLKFPAQCYVQVN